MTAHCNIHRWIQTPDEEVSIASHWLCPYSKTIMNTVLTSCRYWQWSIQCDIDPFSQPIRWAEGEDKQIPARCETWNNNLNQFITIHSRQIHLPWLQYIFLFIFQTIIICVLFGTVNHFDSQNIAYTASTKRVQSAQHCGGRYPDLCRNSRRAAKKDPTSLRY